MRAASDWLFWFNMGKEKDIGQRVKEIIAENLNLKPKDIGLRASFDVMEVDSFRKQMILIEICIEYGVDFPEGYNPRNAQQIISYVRKNLR